MTLHTNHVLIRLTKKTDELQLGNISMKIETVFDEERHQRIVGIIEEVPATLTFENLNHSQMPWETTMEARVGDEVIIRRTDVSSAMGEGKSYEQDDHLYIYVPYHALILVKRKVNMMFVDPYILKDDGPLIGSEGEINAVEWAKKYQASVEDILNPDNVVGQKIIWENRQHVNIDNELFEVIMLNGYMLVEQDDEDFGLKLALPDEMKDAKAQTGTIRFIGSCNTAYHDQFLSNGDKVTGAIPDAEFDLKVGDRIGFLKFAAQDLEFELHRTFNGTGKHFVRMQRNKVLCKID